MLLTKIRKELRSSTSRFTAIEGSVAAAYFDSDYDALNEAEARVVEGRKLRAHPVGSCEASGFTSFLDGVQRADVKFNYEGVPLIYGYGAAVIRKRVDRILQTELLSEHEALFFPSAHVPRAHVLQQFPDEELIDITPHYAEPVPLFPPLIYSRAKQFLNEWRKGLECKLAEQWCAAPTGFLLVDGSLTISEPLSRSTVSAGIIKSHHTRFFDGADARIMLNLKEGERTSVFEPHVRQPVRSWYLRVRSADGHDPMWGLVRVEVAKSLAVEVADDLSRWILAEMRPIALPDSRWDRLLYPIHDCEEYLRARAPRL